MTLTPQQNRQFAHLFVLADAASELPTIELKFVTFWENLREDLGLAELLLKLQLYVKQENNIKTKSTTPETSQTKETTPRIESNVEESPQRPE